MGMNEKVEEKLEDTLDAKCEEHSDMESDGKGLPFKYLRKPGESEEEYIYRICNDKAQIGSWEAVANIINSVLGYEYTECKYRKTYQAYCKLFNAVGIKMIHNDQQYLDSINQKIDELKKERYKYYDQRNAYNKLLRDRSRQEELNDIITAAIKDGDLPVLQTVEQPKGSVHSTLLISFNDLHCGATIDNYWNTYNTDIMKQRVEDYLQAVLAIQKKEQAEEAVVWCNGDMISGSIHMDIRITNREHIIEQVVIASETISQFLADIAPYFKAVHFVSVSGNHSRLGKWDEALRDEKLDRLVSWYAKARLQNIHNIFIEEYTNIDSSLYVINIRGLNYIGVHGDYDSGVSHILSLQQMTNRKIYCILSGHLHHNQYGDYQNIKTLMAGSFMGVDDLCVQKRILGRPEQCVAVVDETGIHCLYDVGLMAGVKA